tara:strand:- start:12 stop:728 length:717 start_codon:yes stop_codon:yes gene_type:complete
VKREIKIFTSANDGHVPVDTGTLDALENIEMTEMLVRKYIRNKLLEESYGDPIGSGDPTQEILQWAEEGNRVTVLGKNIWPGLGNRAGLHDYADKEIRNKWDKSGPRFIKKIDQLPAGTEVELKRYQSTSRGKGRWVTAGTVITTGAVPGSGKGSAQPSPRRMREIFKELSMIYDKEMGRKHVSSVSEYTGEDAPFHGKNWEVTVNGIDRYIHPGSDIGEYAEFDPTGNGSWEVYSLY